MLGDQVMIVTIDEISELIEKKEWKVLRSKLTELGSFEIAEIIEELSQ